MTNTPPFPPICTVEIAVFPGVQVLDVTGPMQVFATANDLLAAADAPPAYALRLVSRAGGPIAASCGLVMLTDGQPAKGPPADMLIVPGGEGTRAAVADPANIAWIAARAERAERVVSVCTGAFLLAAAGLLDGAEATTHWAWCEALAAHHPAVRVAEDALFVQSGRIWTSAGVTAGIDLALALLEADCGRDLALAVARQLVVFARRPGGQAQFSAGSAAGDLPGRFAGLAAFVVANLRADLSLARLAAEAGMSERSFLRHWPSPAGCTPARWVERLRVEAAQADLAQPGASVKRTALRCGFGSPEALRRSFQRVLGVPPGAWRDRFVA